MGGKICLCVFWGSVLVGEAKHINKHPPEMSGRSREMFLYVYTALNLIDVCVCGCNSIFIDVGGLP